MKGLSAVSADEHFDPTKTNDKNVCIYKLLKMDKLEVFWGPNTIEKGVRML